MTGFFPIMMFALPAGALAIIHTARKEKRKLVASIFIGTAFASFLTGITEPLEFAFMFAAPFLFVIHAILTGLSGFILYQLEVRHGFGFSAGFIDYAINYQLATNPLLIIPVGLAFAVVYYFLFRFIIVKFNIKTPGREDETAEDKADNKEKTAAASGSKAENVLHALGGSSNIVGLDACITRLRLVVKDESIVNDTQLKGMGAAGIIRLGKGAVQVIFGTQSEQLKDEIKK